MGDEHKERGTRIYRLIDRGPTFWGLPVMQCALLLGAGAGGFFIVRGFFGNWGGLARISITGVAWACLGWLHTADKTFISMLMLKLTVKLYPRTTSYVPGRQRVVLKR